jgi:hypothetical protein
VREKLWNHRGGRVDRHGEADALGHREHRSVDADDPAAGVGEREEQPPLEVVVAALPSQAGVAS